MEHLEGRQSVLAALRARLRRFEVVLVSERTHASKTRDVLASAEDLRVPVKHVPPRQLDAMAHGRTHGGVIAVCTPRPPTPPAVLLERLGEPAFLTLIDGVEDSRNLGFVLRSAEAFGVDGVLVKKHAWDFDGADLSRASSGAFERIRVVRMDREGDLLSRIRKRGIRLYGCIAGARRSIYEADFNRPVLIAVGGEKRGLSASVRKHCDRFVSIPTVEGAASLSLPHAAAVAMAEVMRQRRK